MPEASKEGWIYTVPPGRWEERGAGGTQTGEFINVAPRCQLGAGGAGGGAAGASMPPLFDEASGRAASDGRCAPALPAALDHFHAKPRPRHPPSCGPRAGGNAPAAAGAGGPGWAWEPRRRFQRRAAGRERPSGQGRGREGGGLRGGGSPLSVPAQPWLNGSPRARALRLRAEQRLPRGYPSDAPRRRTPCPAYGAGRRTCPGRWDRVTRCPCLFSSSGLRLGAALAPGTGRLHSHQPSWTV